MRAPLTDADFEVGGAGRSGNRFLDALPPASRARLLRVAQLTPIVTRERLRSFGDPLHSVLFPLSGIVSVVHETADGGAAEVALVGDEGYVGAAIMLGAVTATNALRVQADGVLAIVDRDAFVEELDASPPVRTLAARFASAYFAGISVAAACNALHPATHRLARWILRMNDRIAGDVVPMTQEIAALLIGVRRATVTRAMAGVAAGGAVSYERGAVRIIDREGLERLSCSCYEELRTIAAGVYPEPT